jgi:hypothetical protein
MPSNRDKFKRSSKSKVPQTGTPGGMKPKNERPPLPNNRTNPRKDNSAVTCYNCGQKGHYASDPKCSKYGKVTLNHQPQIRAARNDESSEDEESSDEDGKEIQVEEDESEKAGEGSQYEEEEEKEDEEHTAYQH